MIQNYLKVKQSVCFECQGTQFSTRVLNQHLFIETEYIVLSVQGGRISKNVNCSGERF